MSSNTNVVMGEAPESDSEDELNVRDGFAVTELATLKGRVISGEAPESDEETVGKSVSLDSVNSAHTAFGATKDMIIKSKKDVSLLSKKLCERNTSLAKNVSALATQTVCTANIELNTVDQHLLKCQLQVQEAADILKAINTNVTRLEEKLSILLSSHYIPDITISDFVSNANVSPT